MSEPDDKPATTVAELDLHFRYQRRDMAALMERLDAITRNMATKADIETLTTQMREFVRRGEFEDLKRLVTEGNASTTFWRLVEAVTKIGAAVAVIATIGGLVVALVHFADKVPK